MRKYALKKLTTTPISGDLFVGKIHGDGSFDSLMNDLSRVLLFVSIEDALRALVNRTIWATSAERSPGGHELWTDDRFTIVAVEEEPRVLREAEL